jgi:coenzyme F420-reducing hydrogenase beta subunit
MEKNYRNVCEVIVKNDFCVGCGICAGICPVHVLEMKLNKYGEYQPVEIKKGCLPKCDLCFRGCPFWNQVDNEDSLAKGAFGNESVIKHRNETGYYIDSFVGYSKVDGHRANGASGGMATWLLETLFTEGFVDHIICVTHNPEPGKLYKFSVINSIEEIRSASRSCYYPVELSAVIDYILTHEGQYAIIGLPCFLKGIRLASRTSVKLKRRITYLLGLVCGQLKSTFFSQYLCALRGGDPKSMDYCQFRIKDSEREANDFGFSFNCTKGNIKSGTVFWKEGMREVWTNGFFKLNACNFCDDIFAELADVVFMDAWIDPYIYDSKGTNIVLCRNKNLSEIFSSGKTNGNIHFDDLPIEKVIKSQQAVIDIKRKQLAQRLRLSKMVDQKYFPQKRIKPSVFCPIILFERFLERRVVNSSKQVMSRFGINETITNVENETSFSLFVLALIGGIRNRLSVSYIRRQINRLRSIFS